MSMPAKHVVQIRPRPYTSAHMHMGGQITGGTAYWLNDGANTGDIAAQDWCWVKPGDTADEPWRRDLAPHGLATVDQSA